MTTERANPSVSTVRGVARATTLGAGLFGVLGALGVLATSLGCYNEGGPGWSADRGALVSTPLQPKTWSVIDTRTGQTVFTIEIPVGKRFIFSFSTGGGDPANGLPDRLAWDLWEPDESFGQPKNRVNVPEPASRRTEWVFRPSPELPTTLKPKAPIPTQPEPSKPAPGATD